MVHIRPQRWADAAAGRLSEAEIQAMDAHARECPTCAGERERVEHAVSTYAAIREVEPPPQRWDHIGARIYWATSQERRGPGNGPNRLWSIGPLVRRARSSPRSIAIGVTAACVVVAAWSLWLRGDPGQDPGATDSRMVAVPQPDSRLPDQRRSVPSSSHDGPSAPESADGSLRGVVTFLQGEVTSGGERLEFDRLITAGTEIVTDRGRVAVQFDEGSGFALGEQSSLRISRFGDDGVTLEVDGEIVVGLTSSLAHRRKAGDSQWSFVVIAGSREVRVTGTVFRVLHRDGELTVSCSRGAVSIRDGAGRVALGAGQVARFIGEQVQQSGLDVAAIAAMDRAVPRVPAWAQPEAVLAKSATLDIASSAKEPIEIDGISMGEGSFSLRVMPGRHHVRAEGVPGSWLDLEAGSLVAQTIRPAGQRRSADRNAGQPRSTDGRRVTPSSRTQAAREGAAKRQRRGQLDRALAGNPRLQMCVRSLRKQGIVDGAFVVVDLGVLRTGEIEYLNIVDSNLPGISARCIRDVIDEVTFPSGAAASLTYRITLGQNFP